MQTLETRIAKLYPEQQDAFRAYVKRADKVLAAHPEYSDTAKAAIHERVSFELYTLEEGNRRANSAVKNPEIDTAQEITNEKLKFQNEMSEKWLVKSKTFGLDGARALSDLENEANPGMMGSLTKIVYDKNDGGVQWGGLAGIIGGALLGMMGSEFAGGGILGTLLIAGGALLGGWLGDKGSEAIGSMLNKGEKKPSVTEMLDKRFVMGKAKEKESDLTTVTATRIMETVNTLRAGKADNAVIADYITRESATAEGNLGVDIKRLKDMLNPALDVALSGGSTPARNLSNTDLGTLPRVSTAYANSLENDKKPTKS